MLNKKNRVEAVNNLEKAINKFEIEKAYMVTQSEKLYKERLVLKDNVKKVWQFLNSMRNKPEDNKIEVEKLKIEFKKFEKFVYEINEEIEASLKKTAGGASGGVAAGVGVAAFGPSAAMAIATTFGTASTGTAISTLSGAAATNAALAWLGGGALTAGGGGTAAGSALLALAGPIGWTIAGATLLTSIALFTKQKFENRKAKEEALTALKQNTALVRTLDEKIGDLLERTVSLRERISQSYSDALPLFGADFQILAKEQQSQLAALVNNTKACATQLGRRIELEGDSE